jgi:glucose/arabinose dehydrogenase
MNSSQCTLSGASWMAALWGLTAVVLSEPACARSILRIGFAQWVCALLLGAMASSQAADAATPTGFQESVVFSGLVQPTAIRFAPDGYIFVAEKRGVVKVYKGFNDTNPVTFADLRTNVYNFWDRGLLGLALHPNYPAVPYVYVLYTYDGDIGLNNAPKWGTPGVDSDPCPTPPGATDQGCVVSGHLSRIQATRDAGGNLVGGTEQVLIEDWCQQFPSHSIGSLVFGHDGALYVSGGDGASFNYVDYGQMGNVCGDPVNEGGALRSQDLRTSSDPVTLDGTILRVDPATGAGWPTNPQAGSSNANARRVIAYGLRNPFRINVRPGANNEIWIGDVGWTNWEEINLIPNTTDGIMRNFGWPCYEGNGRQAGYDGANLPICENLYTTSEAITPFFTYSHSLPVFQNDPCPSGSSAIAGIAFEFYSGGPYPSRYDGALFFADYSRNCIWAVLNGANGTPDPSTIENFVVGASGPVDLQVSPDGELFYAGFNGGTIRRIKYCGAGNQCPIAVIAASATIGTAPLTVNFSGNGSSDPDADPLTYGWDLNGDLIFTDSTAVQTSYTFTQPGSYIVRLRVTDSKGASDTASLVIVVSGGTANTPPTVSIDSPAAGTTWKVGDTITFSGSATDAQDGQLPASALSWSLFLWHCPSTCHTHSIQDFPGVGSGSFVAPDHEYPSYLELTLRATDTGELTDTKTIRLDPRTVALTFQTVPGGMQLVVGSSTSTSTFARTVIVGSRNSVIAPSPQIKGKQTYRYESWSDGGAQTHDIIAPTAASTYTARFAK